MTEISTRPTCVCAAVAQNSHVDWAKILRPVLSLPLTAQLFFFFSLVLDHMHSFVGSHVGRNIGVRMYLYLRVISLGMGAGVACTHAFTFALPSTFTCLRVCFRCL